MITTPTPTHPPDPTADSVLAGIGVAISLQLLTAVAAFASIFVVLAAALAIFGSSGGEQESTW